MPGEMDCRLHLFCKTPVSGKVKTRLAAGIGADNACELARSFIRWTVSHCIGEWPGPVVLHVWPDTDHPFIQQLATEFQVAVAAQVGDDLGDRMANVLQSSPNSNVVNAVMGCDIPHMSTEQLLLAAQSMRAGKTVLGPAADGGFYFFASQNFSRSFFDGLRWGSSSVLPDLLENMTTNFVDVDVYLETLVDIDTPEDLDRAAGNYSLLQQKLKQLSLR